MQIPVKRGMLSANREFQDVAGVIIFPTHPGSRINLLRAGKTLLAITPTTSTFFIQFGSFEPINVEIFSTPKVTSNVLKDNSGTSIKFCHKEPLVVDDEGWTLVTRRRNRKGNIFDTIKRGSEKTSHGEKTNKDEQV
jgi:hypothetical protein